MPGVTKHIYDADIRDIHSMWNKQLKNITYLLPQNYEEADILKLLIEFYPYEWESVGYKKRYYDVKDKYIKAHRGKCRYNMPMPIKLLRSNSVYRRLCSEDFRKKYDEAFDRNTQLLERDALEKKRIPKIKRIREKIEYAKYYTQSVTPDFLEKIMGLYERKKTSQKDKVYLLIELKKYYNEKIIGFFFKINDTELNRQLREMAFKHLQSFNYQPRLRKQQYIQIHTKNKKRKEFLKKVYPYQTYNVPATPGELARRIVTSKDQIIKQYDLFVSHSSTDRDIVRKLIENENKYGVFAFCDWMNDSDYLKRNLLCKETLKVIEHRLDNSKALVFVRTPAALESLWCKYEINYYYKLGKPMYVIDGELVEQDVFEKAIYNPEELLCENYEKLLFNQS